MSSESTPLRQAATKPTRRTPSTPLSLQSASPQEPALPSSRACRRQPTARATTTASAMPIATTQVQPDGITIWKRMGSI